MDSKILRSDQAYCWMQIFPTDSASHWSVWKSLEDAEVTAVDESIPFEVETDASEAALAATLNQNGRPVAFFSRTLWGSELKHASIEKEA